MAEKNPTDGRRAVLLDLPPSQITILRDTLAGWIGGVRGDLETPERMRNPDPARQEAEAFERLLEGLERGEVLVPDAAALAALSAAANGYDEANDYAEIVANHDALHGLLALLKGEEG